MYDVKSLFLCIGYGTGADKISVFKSEVKKSVLLLHIAIMIISNHLQSPAKTLYYYKLLAAIKSHLYLSHLNAQTHI